MAVYKSLFQKLRIRGAWKSAIRESEFLPKMCIRDRILFAENPGIVIQISDKHKNEVKKILEDAGIGFVKLDVYKRQGQNSPFQQ